MGDLPRRGWLQAGSALARRGVGLSAPFLSPETRPFTYQGALVAPTRYSLRPDDKCFKQPDMVCSSHIRMQAQILRRMVCKIFELLSASHTVQQHGPLPCDLARSKLAPPKTELARQTTNCPHSYCFSRDSAVFLSWISPLKCQDP